MKYDHLNPAAKRAIRRRMHYSDKRARRWYENHSEEHITTMVSQYYLGFGNMSSLLKFNLSMIDADVKANKVADTLKSWTSIQA